MSKCTEWELSEWVVAICIVLGVSGALFTLSACIIIEAIKS